MPRFQVGSTIAFVYALLVVCILVFSMSMTGPSRVSAVITNGVGVYWNGDCTDIASSIDWGTLVPGSVKNVAVYIQNEGEKLIYLILSTTNWNPSKAYQYLNLRWNYTGRRMDPSEILPTKLMLSVSPHIEGISSFSFDILITGSENLPGDVNGDGIVNIKDIVICALAYGSKLGDPDWNPVLDLNQDGIINNSDLVKIAMDYGKTA